MSVAVLDASELDMESGKFRILLAEESLPFRAEDVHYGGVACRCVHGAEWHNVPSGFAVVG